MRGILGHETVVDSGQTLLQFEVQHLPVWYFPRVDVRTDLFVPSAKRTKCPYKGTASYWDIVVGDRVVKDAVWSYEDAVAGREDIKDRFAFYWNRLDAWFEEDDEVFVHPCDPYHRVDVCNSSRHVRIELDGVELANTTRPRLLFETGLPVRYYIPRVDVNERVLEHVDTTSQCPYKGVASYFAAVSATESSPTSPGRTSSRSRSARRSKGSSRSSTSTPTFGSTVSSRRGRTPRGPVHGRCDRPHRAVRFVTVSRSGC